MSLTKAFILRMQTHNFHISGEVGRTQNLNIRGSPDYQLGEHFSYKVGVDKYIMQWVIKEYFTLLLLGGELRLPILFKGLSEQFDLCHFTLFLHVRGS